MKKENNNYLQRNHINQQKRTLKTEDSYTTKNEKTVYAKMFIKMQNTATNSLLN